MLELVTSEVAPEGSAGSDPRAVIAAFHASLRELQPKLRVVPVLLAANLLVFAAMVVRGVPLLAPTAEQALAWGANYGPKTLGGEPWRLFTSMFVHFGILHAVFNMFVLWDSGRSVERIFGSGRFAAIYLASGLGGSVASLLVHPQLTSAGASGAVFGIYGALAGFLRRQRGAIPKPVLTKLAGLAGGFIAYNVFYGFTNPNIDNAAHLGGLVMGGLTGAVLARPLAPRRDADPARPALVAAIAVALSGAITLVVPRPPDFFEFAAIETRVIGDYNAIIESAQAGTRQPAEVADDIERKILPGWRTVHPLLKTPRGAGKQQVKVFDILRRYAQAREETWTFMVAALRGDHAAFEAQKASEGDLEGIMKELEQASAGN